MPASWLTSCRAAVVVMRPRAACADSREAAPEQVQACAANRPFNGPFLRNDHLPAVALALPDGPTVRQLETICSQQVLAQPALSPYARGPDATHGDGGVPAVPGASHLLVGTPLQSWRLCLHPALSPQPPTSPTRAHRVLILEEDRARAEGSPLRRHHARPRQARGRAAQGELILIVAMRDSESLPNGPDLLEEFGGFGAAD
eukprot:5811759-Prymnesium_polylepis.1